MLQLKLGGTPTVLRGVVLLHRPEVSPFEVNTQSTHGVKNEEFKLGCIVVFATSSKQDSRVNRCLTKKTMSNVFASCSRSAKNPDSAPNQCRVKKTPLFDMLGLVRAQQKT